LFNFFSVNLQLVRSHQEKIIVVTRLIQGRNNMTRVGAESRSCDHDLWSWSSEKQRFNDPMQRFSYRL